MNNIHNVVILGSGCAGNTAAIYTARASLKPLVLEGHEPGGQLSITTEVENFPGFPEGIHGPELVQNMKKQAERFGATFEHGRVVRADLSKRPFTLELDHGGIVQTHTLIVATGASARWLGLENEQKLIGHGVSSCATCDGFFFRGKKIMVVGGGDSAMEEANFLSRFGSEVMLVHRKDTFRASKIMYDRALANPKIKMITNTVVEEIHDVTKNEVTSVKLRNLKTNERTINRWMASLWPLAIFPIRSPLLRSLIWMRTATSFRMAARAPILKEFFTPAMCKIAIIGRPLQRRVRVVWRRLRWSGF